MANHHYVPRFYLEKFCDIRTPAGQTPFLWVGQRGKETWKRRAPKNVGYEPDLYETGLPGKERAAVEELFGRAETDAAKLYRSKLDRFEIPTTADERGVLNAFAASFVVRSPFYRSFVQRTAKELADQEFWAMAAQPGPIRDFIRDYKARTGKDLPAAAIPELRLKPWYVTSIAMLALTGIGQLLDGMNWKFLIAPQWMYFLTCDSPAFWMDTTSGRPKWMGHGLAMKNVEFTLPLSRKLCLLAGWNFTPGLFIASDEQVRRINTRAVGWADKEFYSPAEFALSPTKLEEVPIWLGVAARGKAS